MYSHRPSSKFYLTPYNHTPRFFHDSLILLMLKKSKDDVFNLWFERLTGRFVPAEPAAQVTSLIKNISAKACDAIAGCLCIILYVTI